MAVEDADVERFDDDPARTAAPATGFGASSAHASSR
jgi:hypothetical protein